MRGRSLSLAVLSLTLAGSAPAQEKEGSWHAIFSDFFLGPERRDEFRWSGRIAQGATLEVKGVNGRIAATPATGREIELVASKRGRRHDPKLVEVAFVEHAGGLTICAVYPAAGGAPNECQPGSGGRLGARNSDVVVDFEVKLPAGLSLVARTVNGGIQASGVTGGVEAYTVNGGVQIDAQRQARAETVNGSIRATLAGAEGKEPLAFKTVNGSVRVVLPASAGAKVRVETVNGGIDSEFTMNGVQRTRRSLSGTIGGGGRELSIETVNGSVALRRAG